MHPPSPRRKRRAKAGDTEAAGLWESRAAGIWEEIEKAARIYIDHQQQESGYVRTGHHGARVGDAEAGRFERAADIPVAIFPQHTSRNGDPQLHVHILWLNRVKTESDGQWRAIDSRALTRNKQEGAVKAAFALESALSERYGFSWAYREESKGRIQPSAEKAIGAFSSRRAQISAKTRDLAEEYERNHGHAPDQRALASMRLHANHETRKGKGEEKLDMDAKLREWEKISRDAELGTLRDLARDIWGTLGGQGQDAERGEGSGGAGAQRTGILTPAEERAAMAAGIARLQQAHSTWSRPELVRSIAQSMPDHARAADSAQAVSYLDQLADRALAGEAGEEVRRLDAPEYPRVPDSLRRADGESIYTAHGAARYATAGQLSMEDRILDRAQEKTATRVAPEVAAHLLGADLAQLEAQLRDAAQAAQDPGARTSTGLRLDQATAAFLALTSDRRVEPIVAAAGTGKTYTAAKLAEAWEAAGMGKVYGLTMTSAGRNVLTEAGFEHARNTAEHLGHTKQERGARGVEDIGPKALIVIDEATQVSMQDLDSILANAKAMDARVVAIGDPVQLPAVESGGGFDMITRQLGFAQLNEVARFNHDWEGDASLALRDGELSALAEYDAQGRLHGGTHEEMAEQAVRAFLADHLAGKSTILTAYEHADRDELNRRTQEYLREWGQLDTSASASLAEGRAAHPGDLIRATENNNRIMAGSPVRTLANGDIMRVVSIGTTAMTVERQTGTDAGTGGRMWSEPFNLPLSYAAQNADLGYAQTNHSVQGSTVTSGIALANERNALSALYPAATRGREENHVYAYDSASFAGKRWGEGQGTKPGPELERHDRLEAERDGREPDRQAEDHDPVSILSRAVRNGNRELSATEYRERALGNADHLGLLGHIFGEQVRAESSGRFTSALREVLGPDRADDALKDTDDLWRALRAAELAGKDGAEVLREAAAQRDLGDAANVSAVLAHRVREMTEHLPPQHRDSWASRVRETGDPDHHRYLREVAEAMDGRQERIGKHAAEHPPLWARQALGDVPDDPDARAEWEDKAGKIGAFREMYSWNHPGQAIGPEPNTTSPEARSEWHNALGALAKFDGIDVRGLTDGQLMLRRDAYERETSWAPKYVAEELRLARLAEHNSRVEESRHRFEAEAADKKGDQDRADLHRQMAGSFLSLGARSADMREKFEQAQETRSAWERITEPTLRLAQASDAELHRRGVLGADDKLKSAEPAGIKYPEPSDEQTAQDEKQQPTRAETEERQRRALGLTRDHGGEPELAGQVAEIVAYNREQQAKIDELLSLREPAEDPDEIDLGQAWSTVADRERAAIIQPPKPEIKPAEAVAELARERDMEAGG